MGGEGCGSWLDRSLRLVCSFFMAVDLEVELELTQRRLMAEAQGHQGPLRALAPPALELRLAA